MRSGFRFVSCSGDDMVKKVVRYFETYKKVRTFYKSIGSDLTEADIEAGLTLKQKMNVKCHYFFRMHALFGAHANIETPALGDSGLPAHMVFDIRDLCQDSQAAFQFFAADPMLSEDEEEAANREEEPIDLGGDPNVQSVDDVRSRKTVRSRDRALPQERKSSLITTYEEQLKERLVLRKEAQDQKSNFWDAILEDRRHARKQREKARIQERIEAMRRARADRRSTLMEKMMKTRKSMDELQATFLLLDNVEERFSASM
ncbi:hypothetical protein R1sor_001953 [Riccia sorocarpa]|uniref:Uncharacterized protein n=1 Tax=Riccia sorocarpa TaxID=122646 RepID=A0ABD3GZ15_9MARC